MPLSPPNSQQEHLEPPVDRSRLVGFIGGYLISQGTLSLQQLDEALAIQLRYAENGEIIPFTDVLIRLKLATRQDIARAEHSMLQDRAASRMP